MGKLISKDTTTARVSVRFNFQMLSPEKKGGRKRVASFKGFLPDYQAKFSERRGINLAALQCGFFFCWPLIFHFFFSFF